MLAVLQVLDIIMCLEFFLNFKVKSSGKLFLELIQELIGDH